MIRKLKVDKLLIHIFEKKSELARYGANIAEEIINGAIQENGKASIILATGTSQFEFIASLCNRKIDWKKVTAFHLDEYVGIKPDHPASFRRYLKERIIDKVGIGTVFLIEGDCDDIFAECKRLNDLLAKYKIDVAFVGIGENGHLAFNDPPAKFDDKDSYKVVNLDNTSRKQQIGEGWFKTINEVPKKAITMTIPAIMNASAIICNAPEKRKAAAVKKTLLCEISPEIPASVIRNHPRSILLLDKFSASTLNGAFLKKHIIR